MLAMGVIFCLCSCKVDQNEVFDIVISEVNVVDVVNGKIDTGQFVYIEGNRIFDIRDDLGGKERDGIKVIDGKGKYLLPGLWDMHFHLCWERSNDSLIMPLLLRYGITGIREMGGDLEIQDQFKNLVKNDPIKGPEIYGPGPFVDGDPPLIPDFSLIISDTAGTKDRLDSLVKKGADFIKVYSLLKMPALSAVSKYCKSNKVHFSGHLSEYVEPEKSISMGQRSIEHLNRLDEIWRSDSSRLESLIDSMLKYDTWLCPTLLVYWMKAHIHDPGYSNQVMNKYIHPYLMSDWEQTKKRRIREFDPEAQSRLFRQQQELVYHIYKRGVPMLAGSDFGGMAFIYPGVGLYEELELLHKTGIPVDEVIRMATINPSRFLNRQNELGSVEEGKLADLVLIRGNPLQDLKNLREIELVIRRGKFFHPKPG